MEGRGRILLDASRRPVSWLDRRPERMHPGLPGLGNETQQKRNCNINMSFHMKGGAKVAIGDRQWALARGASGGMVGSWLLSQGVD